MRRSITIDGFSHGNNPVPAASVVGNILMTGAIFGTDTATGRLADGLALQCAHMFDLAGRILHAAGADFGDVIKMTVFLAPDQPRAVVNTHWVSAFPDPLSRPARHVIVSDRLPAGMLIQCDLVAVLDAHAVTAAANQ